MSKREAMRELFDKADKVKPMAEKDGQVFVTFDEAATLNSLNSYEGKGTGMQMRNPDGSLASTGKTVHAVNPDYFFANRYKVKGTKGNQKLIIVSGHEPIGFRVIKEQEQGKLFIKTIPCYVIGRNSETGKLELEKVATVSDSEFISDFTHTLKHESMAEILPLIANSGTGITADDMPI